jgi:teichuronic acid biosynthesis glycosyltransferase TuaC
VRIAVLTSLFPVPARPHEGSFAETRWALMAERGHAVTVVQPLPWAPRGWVRGARAELACAPRRESRRGLPVERPRYLHLPRRDLGNARRFARSALATLDRCGGFDVAICDYAWPAAAAVEGLRRAGLPCVIHGRGSDVTAVSQRPELAAELGRALRRCAHWCAVSRDLLAAMDLLAADGREGTLTPNGVDGERFHPGDRRGARASLGLSFDGPLVLVVGHWIPRKDPLLALRAFARGAPPEARLVFLGRGELGPALERAVQAAGLGARVELRGEAPPEDLARWYRAADLLLLASEREGRPNVVLEALASGLSVVATAAGGTPELLAGLEGATAPVGDESALAQLVARRLAAPWGPAACRAAVAELTWPAALARLEAVLEAARREPPR